MDTTIKALVTCPGPLPIDEDTPIDVWVRNARRPSGSAVTTGKMIVVLRDEKLQAVAIHDPRRPARAAGKADPKAVVLRADGEEEPKPVAEVAGDFVKDQGFHAMFEAELVPGALYIVDVTLEISPKSPFRGFWRLRRRAWF